MENTLEKLSGHLETIYFCVHKGFNSANAFLDSSEAFLGKTARANVIREYVINEIKKAFPTELIFNNSNRLKGLIINGIIVRFKKVDQRFRAGNIPTKQALAFASQMQVPGVSSTINLNAGWLLDKSGTAIDKITLIKPNSLFENGWIVNIGEYLANKNSIYQVPLLQNLEEQQLFQEEINVYVKPDAVKKRIRKEEHYG